MSNLANVMDIPFQLTPRQVEAGRLLAGPQRHTMLVGGSRSTKTFTFVRAIVMRALKAPNSRHAIFRLRYNACRASVWLDTFPKVIRLCFPQLIGKIKPNRADGYEELPNGSQIWFAGLDEKARVEKILGMEFATIFFNECSQIAYSSVVLVLTRLAQKCAEIINRAYYDLNPTGSGHWTHRLFIEGVDPDTRQPLMDAHEYKFLYMNPRDNMANLDAAYIRSLEAMPERQRRRFLEGKYVAEVDGALWTIELLERQRWDETELELPELRRKVVAIDPSGASGKEDKRSDEIGITAAGVEGSGGHSKGYVLGDYSGRMGPEEWARTAIGVYHRIGADAIVAEQNFGGDMVRAVIHGQDANVPVKLVTASRGKAVRAEPVANLYEMGRIYHVGRFAMLEDQLCNFSVSGYTGDRSPDRADSLVWAITDLMLAPSMTGLLDYYRAEGQRLEEEAKAKQAKADEEKF